MRVEVSIDSRMNRFSLINVSRNDPCPDRPVANHNPRV
jgi:hypothetical protein